MQLYPASIKKLTWRRLGFVGTSKNISEQYVWFVYWNIKKNRTSYVFARKYKIKFSIKCYK